MLSKPHARNGDGAATVALLRHDPELGRLLTGERLAVAQRELRVRTTQLAVGEWDARRLADVAPANVGLLIVDGVLARHVELQDTVSTELLGAGDIVRPWRLDDAPGLLAVQTRWNALSPVHLALLDADLAATLGRYPEVGTAIVDRLVERSKRLAVSQAISHLTRVEDRLVALLWLFAERWGRVTTDGVVVPLTLSHRLLGELVGARRPTISTALSKLAREGRVTRRPDGTWRLSGDPPASSGKPTEVVRQRRRLTPATPEAVAPSNGHQRL